MPNCVIYQTGSDDISLVIEDAVRVKNRIVGMGGGSFISKKLQTGEISIVWTNDIVNRVYQDVELPGYGVVSRPIGYDKQVSEITPIAGDSNEIQYINNSDVPGYVQKRNDIAKWNFTDLDTYIDNNVTDLASAKAFLKKLAKVVLAELKINDSYRD